MPTEPPEEEQQPQRILETTMKARTEKETASLSKVTVSKPTGQQIIEDFIDSMSCKNDVVMLIDKLLYAIGQEDVIDWTCKLRVHNA
jgi:hypothetical protein